jgi:hypothetical protein
MQEAVRGMKVDSAPGADGIPIRVLEYIPYQTVAFLMKEFSDVLQGYLPPA